MERTLKPPVAMKELRCEILVLRQRLLQELPRGLWLQAKPLQRARLLRTLARQASTIRMSQLSKRQSDGAAAHAGAGVSQGKDTRQTAL